MYYSSSHLVTILNELLKRVSPAIFLTPPTIAYYDEIFGGKLVERKTGGKARRFS